MYAVLAGNGNVITQNDMCAVTADGGVTPPGSDSAWLSVTRAAPTDGYTGGAAVNKLVGSALSFFFIDAGNVGRPSARIPASQAGTAFVLDHQDQRYVAAARDTAIASQLTNMGNCADIYDSTAALSYSTPQGTFGGISQQGIDLNTTSATAHGNMRLWGKYAVTGNAFGSSTTDNLHGKYVCSVNEHFSRLHVVGI